MGSKSLRTKGNERRNRLSGRSLNDIGNRVDDHTVGIGENLFNLEAHVTDGLPAILRLLLKAATQQFFDSRMQVRLECRVVGLADNPSLGESNDLLVAAVGENCGDWEIRSANGTRPPPLSRAEVSKFRECDPPELRLNGHSADVTTFRASPGPASLRIRSPRFGVMADKRGLHRLSFPFVARTEEEANHAV